MNISEIIFEKLTVEEQERVRGGEPLPLPNPLSCSDDRPEKPCS